MYFDLHNHPSFKSYLSHSTPDGRDDCWKTYNNFIDKLFGSIIDSQSSLQQIQDGDVEVSVATIYVMEKGLGKTGLVKTLLPAISPLDRRMLRRVRTKNYFTSFEEEVVHLEKSHDLQNSAKQFKIVSDAQDLTQRKTNLVLAIEGGHILKPTKSADPIFYVDKLKHFRHRILYLTLCHFTRNALCTHAHSLKFVNAKRMTEFLPQGMGITEVGREVILRCYDTSPGAGNNILIDVKHMSLMSRRHFYQLRDEMGAASVPIIASHVAICGISWDHEVRKRYHEKTHYLGKEHNYSVKYSRPEGLRLGQLVSHFNPTSINLYDEDIVEIVASGGLIGLILDERQLGCKKKLREYFDGNEFKKLMNTDDPLNDALAVEVSAAPSLNNGREMDEIEEVTDEERFFEQLHQEEIRDEQEEEFTETLAQAVASMTHEERSRVFVATSSVEELAPKLREIRRKEKEREHLLHLCNNILHIVKVGGPKAWHHICIGSDCDGLINTIKGCRNVTEYRQLETGIVEMIEALRQNDNKFDNTYHIYDVEAQVRDLMYNNGKTFLENHFSRSTEVLETQPLVA
ncbi:microsomal dipeptidase-like Zn-dependent dipeptidase [Lewinella aquimaris]|uniref:Microsomal dipeptidase-like Zn-dependent dipeptidase n=1 Tax=Neolewinella aquimaris TaxID=1835722 RepID=A0A840E992_9BACT|nr:membrane dipeptidase [Neolewinella aquimaris]MBB4080292.1 microsomal dipeptidase-like Zn-dependent dipeptidase [Neolewinella aquimaris]